MIKLSNLLCGRQYFMDIHRCILKLKYVYYVYLLGLFVTGNAKCTLYHPMGFPAQMQKQKV